MLMPNEVKLLQMLQLVFYFVNAAEEAADYLNTKINALSIMFRREQVNPAKCTKEQVNLYSTEDASDDNFSIDVLIVVFLHGKHAETHKQTIQAGKRILA